MKILIAEDDSTSRLLLQTTLKQWGHEVIVTVDGQQAYDILLAEAPPNLAIFDWMMPHLDGIEVCRKAREEAQLEHLYVIMLTTRGTKDDIAEALQAGADDYLNKPFDRKEMQARIQVGKRVLDLQIALTDRVRALEESIKREKHLQGLLPICSYCKKIRDDQNYWQQVERYVETRADVSFSHSICPECYEIKVKPELEAFQAEIDANKDSPDSHSH
ncbi:MAG TPA: response regulator [Candidatus Latescibacteria bacterium]|nr:response regulator [Candidatus Handelsmanbacteria bacterium]HIL11391.1 response regulator [Candidatus Latescibacterota bacterium]